MVPQPAARLDAVDLARGVAITLMILSHGVKGLLTFDQIPQWGLVPIHLLTKISSSLFILVFGMALAIAHLPHAGTAAWPRRRMKLWMRGLVIFFWYKALTVLELAQLYTREDVLNTLSYRAFPVYCEILGFYAIALFWVPLALPVWKRTPRWLQFALPVALAWFSVYLQRSFDFWGSETLHAILVEHPRHYTWGQLSRAPLIFAGLLLGELVLRTYRVPRSRWLCAGALAAAGAALLATFAFLSRHEWMATLIATAKNAGKHPPGIRFMLFSLGGALLVIGTCLAGGKKLAAVFRPLVWIGRNPLQAFVFHLGVLFVFYRYLFDLWRGVSYTHALALSGLLIVLSALWIKTLAFVQSRS